MNNTKKYVIASILIILLVSSGIFAFLHLNNDGNTDSKSGDNSIGIEIDKVDFSEDIEDTSNDTKVKTIIVDQLISNLEKSEDFTLVGPGEDTENYYAGFPTYYTMQNDSIYAITISNSTYVPDNTLKKESIAEELEFIKGNPTRDDILNKKPFIVAYENGVVYGAGGDTESEAPKFGDDFGEAGLIDDVRFDGVYYVGNNIFGSVDDTLIYIREVLDSDETIEDDVELFLQGFGYYKFDKSEYDYEKFYRLLDIFVPVDVEQRGDDKISINNNLYSEYIETRSKCVPGTFGYDLLSESDRNLNTSIYPDYMSIVERASIDNDDLAQMYDKLKEDVQNQNVSEIEKITFEEFWVMLTHGCPGPGSQSTEDSVFTGYSNVKFGVLDKLDYSVQFISNWSNKFYIIGFVDDQIILVSKEDSEFSVEEINKSTNQLLLLDK